MIVAILSFTTAVPLGEKASSILGVDAPGDRLPSHVGNIRTSLRY